MKIAKKVAEYKVVRIADGKVELVETQFTNTASEEPRTVVLQEKDILHINYALDFDGKVDKPELSMTVEEGSMVLGALIRYGFRIVPRAE